MGTLGSTGRIATFRSSSFNYGLDMSRCDIKRALGTFKASSTATFRAGQALMLNSSGELEASDGNNFFGFAKFSKMTTGRAVVVDEEISFDADTGTATLAHADLVSGSVSICSAASYGGTQYALTTDYTVNLTNGIITKVASGSGGTIPLDTTLYVSYTYNMSAADHNRDGNNFFNNQDDVTLYEGRITVIVDWAILFTAEFATNRAYTLTGTGSNIYVNSSAILTNNSSSAKFVGKVIQLPTSTDGFLGVMVAPGLEAVT